MSLLVGFQQFVHPELHLLAGHRVLLRLTVNMVPDRLLPRRRDCKLHLVYAETRFRKDGRPHPGRVAGQGSHRLSTVIESNMMALVSDSHGLDIGQVVPAMFLDAETANAGDWIPVNGELADS